MSNLGHSNRAITRAYAKKAPFPEAFEEPMQIIGGLVARRAISEKRHIVTELIGANADPTMALINAMQAIGYRTGLQAITCSIDEAQRRNLSRGEDNISCYYAEPYQREWLHSAAVEAVDPGGPIA